MMSARTMTMAMRRAHTSKVILSRGSFISTSSRLGLEESSTQTNAEHGKRRKDALDKQKKGPPRWEAELATSSEAAVKADRTAHESPEKLQERTKRAAEETSKTGTSMHDNM
ncbi:hypothetical protein ACJ41O_008413 [Fusarium nematophilum]